MKLNAIRLVDRETNDFSFLKDSEIPDFNVAERSLPSFSPFERGLPEESHNIRFKFDNSMFRAETPKHVSSGKNLELHMGDITQLDFPVDLLAVSAFRGSYHPTPGTVMESLYNRGLNMRDLSRNPELDFRENMGIWLSQPTGIKEISQLICLEVIGRVFTFHEALHNLFSFLSILETRGKQPKSIAIPLLGTGNQGFDKAEVIPALLDETLRFLQIARTIQEVHFVVFSETDANQFSAEMDDQLSKGLIKLSDGKTINHIKKLPPGMGWMARQPK
jgi:hypothetical protein